MPNTRTLILGIIIEHITKQDEIPSILRIENILILEYNVLFEIWEASSICIDD